MEENDELALSEEGLQEVIKLTDKWHNKKLPDKDVLLIWFAYVPFRYIGIKKS